MELFTKDSGTLMPVIAKVAVHRFGVMVPNLLDTGRMIKPMGKEDSSMQMAMFTKANG